jgi:pimeloyl-ACP methyl ester carboxylesterase
VTWSPEPFELEGADGGPLRGDLYHPSADAGGGAHDRAGSSGWNPGTPGREAVLLCHGSRGYKDWGFLPLLAARLAEEGLLAVTFSFTDSGISGRSGAFDEPDRFRRGTYGSELEDLKRVTEWAARRVEDPDTARLGIAGHSRGGAIGILYAPEDPRVRCLASLAAPSRIGVWPERYFEAWRRGEPVAVRDFRTRTELSLGPEIYEDLERNRSRYDVAAALERIECPLLVVQGDKDRSVSVEEAREIASHVPSTLCELHLIEGAGHGFEAGDTIRRTPPQLVHMVELVTAWMRRWLRGRA